MIKQNLIVKLPPMLAGAEMLSALEVRPGYDESVRERDAATRLMALSDLYKRANLQYRSSVTSTIRFDTHGYRLCP